MSNADESEAKLRAEWLHKHKAPKDWIILTGSEVSTIRAELEAVQRERDKASKDAAQLADRLSGLELRTPEELARMERERDGESDADEFERQRNHAIAEWFAEEARRERDEAIKQIHEEARDYELQIKKLCEAYNDLGEQNAKLRDIAERALNNTKLGLDSIQRENQLRAELEELKQLK